MAERTAEQVKNELREALERRVNQGFVPAVEPNLRGSYGYSEVKGRVEVLVSNQSLYYLGQRVNGRKRVGGR